MKKREEFKHKIKMMNRIKIKKAFKNKLNKSKEEEGETEKILKWKIKNKEQKRTQMEKITRKREQKWHKNWVKNYCKKKGWEEDDEELSRVTQSGMRKWWRERRTEDLHICVDLQQSRTEKDQSPNPYSTALKGQFQIHLCFRTGVGKLLDSRATIGPRIERGRGASGADWWSIHVN